MVDHRFGSVTIGQPEVLDRAHDGDELLEVDRLGDVAVGVQIVAAQDVLARRSTWSGRRPGCAAASASALISASTSRPSLRGQVQVEQDQVRARRLGVAAPRGAGRPAPRRRRSTTCRLLRTLPSFSASLVRRTSPGLSSTSRISTGRPNALVHGRHAVSCRAAAGSVKRNVVPSPGLGLDPDAPAVALDDLLADRQADAGARVLVAAVQPLEDDEDPLDVLRLDADAVVAHREEPGSPSSRSAATCTSGRRRRRGT